MHAWRIENLVTWLAVWRNRSLALLALHLLGWLLLGRLVFLPGIPTDGSLALDQWVRAGVFAVVEPRDTLPVTYVDIDDALYRDRWRLPAMTPRDELARLIGALSAARSRLIVVDVDLAWGDRDAAFAAFLAGYDAPTPLIFVRHVAADGPTLELFGSAYDDVFAANERLHWAHAYFFTSADGQIRDWAPWLVVCADGQPQLLPSTAVAALTATRGAALARPRMPPDCRTGGEPRAERIIYTEDFGFPRSQASTGNDVFSFERSAARTLRAEALLDGSRIDAATLLANRVAIVGGSHAAGQDLHNTPIGVLPGAVVQANTVIHALPQLRAEESAWFQRPTVALMFVVLAALSLPFAMAIVAAMAVLTVWLGSNYAIFTSVELALLLFLQFRFMTWLVEPFWKPLRKDGWQMLIPKYLRKKKGP